GPGGYVEQVGGDAADEQQLLGRVEEPVLRLVVAVGAVPVAHGTVRRQMIRIDPCYDRVHDDVDVLRLTLALPARLVGTVLDVGHHALQALAILRDSLARALRQDVDRDATALVGRPHLVGGAVEGPVVPLAVRGQEALVPVGAAAVAAAAASRVGHAATLRGGTAQDLGRLEQRAIDGRDGD